MGASGAPGTAQVPRRWLHPALKPRILNRPPRSHPLPKVSATRCRPRPQWPWRVPELTAIPLSLGDQKFRTLRRLEKYSLRACGSWLLEGATKSSARGEGGLCGRRRLSSRSSGPGCFGSWGRPESPGPERALSTLPGDESAQNWGRVAERGGRWPGGALLRLPSSKITMPIYTRESRHKNPRASTFETESSC